MTTANTVYGPLHAAYLTAKAIAEAAEQAWLDDDSALSEDSAHPARIVSDAADVVRDAARDAWLASGEPRMYELCEGGHWYTKIEASSLAEALAAARDGVDSSNYEITHTERIEVRARCMETGEQDSDKVELDPEEPACAKGEEHEWCSPHEVVGGLKENPGVYGHGAGLIITEVCRHCGAYRETDTWAQDRTDGTQGHCEISYREADEKSREWVEEQIMELAVSETRAYREGR
jgi:hypothetical protein